MVTYLVIGGASLVIITAVVVLLVLKRRPGGKIGGSAHALESSLSNEKLKSDIILNTIVDGVMLIDNERTIQLFNPAAGLLTDWDPKEAIGLDYKAIMQLQDDKGAPFPDLSDPILKAFTEKITVRDRTPYLKTRSNTVMSLDISVTPLLDPKGEPKGVVAIFRDTSEERKQEAQRADFISTASHEMRTPVAAIEGYLALALNNKVSNIDEKARNFLEKAHESTKHLGELFQDLLTSAKAEDGRLINHPVVVETGQFLEVLTDGLKFSAEKKGLGTEFILGSADSVIDASSTNVVKPLYYVHVDPDRIREVITNIFDNAVKYTETGKVTVGLSGDQNVVQIRIADTGPGIPSQDVPHLFQKFYRVDNSATRTIGGTGLGLFICRKIIEMYNGRIWLDSEVGKGSTFYINLPRVSAEQAAQYQRQEATQLPDISATGSTI